MALNFDSSAKGEGVIIPIAATNTADGVIKATKNGAAYVQVPFNMNIDKVRLNFALSADINSAGSGNFSVGIYADNVSLTAAAISVAYSSADTYTTIDRANLAVKSLTEGQILRLDVLAVPGGAATAYPMNAFVRIQGTSLA